MNALELARRKHMWAIRRQAGGKKGGTLTLASDIELIFSPAALDDILFDARSKPELKLGTHGLWFRGSPVRINRARGISVTSRRTF